MHVCVYKYTHIYICTKQISACTCMPIRASSQNSGVSVDKAGILRINEELKQLYLLDKVIVASCFPHQAALSFDSTFPWGCAYRRGSHFTANPLLSQPQPWTQRLPVTLLMKEFHSPKSVSSSEIVTSCCSSQGWIYLVEMEWHGRMAMIILVEKTEIFSTSKSDTVSQLSCHNGYFIYATCSRFSSTYITYSMDVFNCTLPARDC